MAQVSRTVAREAGEGLPTAAADPDPLSKHLASVWENKEKKGGMHEFWKQLGEFNEQDWADNRNLESWESKTTSFEKIFHKSVLNLKKFYRKKLGLMTTF